nr:DMT family transporter [Paenibacillus arenilitoris]
MSRQLFAALVLLSLIWGGSFYFIKILLHDFGPWSIAFLRSAFGLATITLIMLVLRKPFGLRSIPWLPMAVMASIHTAIPWAIIAFSETRLTSGMASVLNAAGREHSHADAARTGLHPRRRLPCRPGEPGQDCAAALRGCETMNEAA